MATEKDENGLAHQRKLREYRNRLDVIDAHRTHYNTLSASILAMDDTTWQETQKYARPAEVLESVYHLKKGIEPYGRYEDIAEGPIFELTQLINALCCKWHAILFYPIANLTKERDIDETKFAVNGYAPYADDDIRADDEALRENCAAGAITFNDAAFVGKGLIPVFWEEVDYIRNCANAARSTTLVEIRRLEALNQPLEDDSDVW